jgi:hypothetical protein
MVTHLHFRISWFGRFDVLSLAKPWFPTRTRPVQAGAADRPAAPAMLCTVNRRAAF